MYTQRSVFLIISKTVKVKEKCLVHEMSQHSFGFFLLWQIF